MREGLCVCISRVGVLQGSGGCYFVSCYVCSDGLQGKGNYFALKKEPVLHK